MGSHDLLVGVTLLTKAELTAVLITCVNHTMKICLCRWEGKYFYFCIPDSKQISERSLKVTWWPRGSFMASTDLPCHHWLADHSARPGLGWGVCIKIFLLNTANFPCVLCCTALLCHFHKLFRIFAPTVSFIFASGSWRKAVNTILIIQHSLFHCLLLRTTFDILPHLLFAIFVATTQEAVGNAWNHCVHSTVTNLFL